MPKEFTSSVSESDVSIPYAPAAPCPCVEEGAESVINEQESFSRLTSLKTSCFLDSIKLPQASPFRQTA